MNQILRRTSLTAGLRVAGMVLFLACALLLGGNTLSTRLAAQASTESVVTQAAPSSLTIFTQAVPASFDSYAHLREWVYWRDAHTP